MLCRCGSGEGSYWVSDARGIAIGRVCDKCKNEVLSKYRPEVLSNPNYDCDEPIEAEDY